MLQDIWKRPLRDLRISVTDKCNYRCTYCMPADLFGERYQFLANDQVFTFAEIERLAWLSVQLGVSCLTSKDMGQKKHDVFMDYAKQNQRVT